VPSRDPILRFEDILANIERIEEHTKGVKHGAAFEENHLVCDAVERCLERISEAAKKLGGDAEALCPEVPWPQMRGLGNILRHEYDRVESSRLWYLVQDDLPPLKAAVEAALADLRKRDDGPK
jgi:uncharacterized protein with HEPN domain